MPSRTSSTSSSSGSSETGGTSTARTAETHPDAPPHAMGISPETKADLGRRLARIRGQVEGIGRMVEEERYCPDILQQCAAVHSALRAAEKRLLENHLERCATHAIAEDGDRADQVRREIVDLFGRYMK